MKETPARIAPAGAGRGRRAAIGVADVSEGFVAAGREHGRIVELVTLEPPPAPRRARKRRRASRRGSRDSSGASRRTIRGRKQTGHPMDHAVRVGQRRAQRHVAAALAVHRTASRQSAANRPGNVRRRRAARRAIRDIRPAASRHRNRRAGLHRQGRKEADPCAAGAPARQQMRIDERERGVARDGDTLTGRRQGDRAAPSPETRSGRASAANDPSDRHAPPTKSAERGEPRVEASVSLAWTRPRWRSGSAMSSRSRAARPSDGHARAPRSPRPPAFGAARCRPGSGSTPAISMRGS